MYYVEAKCSHSLLRDIIAPEIYFPLKCALVFHQERECLKNEGRLALSTGRNHNFFVGL